MERYKYDKQNGLWYELQGDYYIPCLTAPEAPKIGSWGRYRMRFLQENNCALYVAMMLSGKLDAHLQEIDQFANQMFEQLIRQYKAAEGLIEEIKFSNQMEWIGRMNSIRERVFETVMEELICQ